MKRGSGVKRAGSVAPAEASSAASVPSQVDMRFVRELSARGRTAMVIDGLAYDFTDFQNDHPGGAEYLRKNKGKVASEEFLASHPVDIIERTLTRAQLAAMTLGPVDAATIMPGDVAVVPAGGSHAAASPTAAHEGGSKPSLDACINIFDFEAIASSCVSEQGWAYYSSGADDEITLRENHSAFHRLWLKPRVMVNVRDIDMRTTILGHPSTLPVYLSAVAMCKLGHPEGEGAWQRAAGSEGIIFMIPTLSSCSMDEITSAAQPSQPMFFQLYVNQDRVKTESIVRKAEALGCSALFITCDAPQLGNREKDRRVKVSHAGAAVQAGSTGTKSEGTAKALTTFIDPSLQWSDLPWFRSITKMKIVLKGIGTAEDAVRAFEAGCSGVVLSNHGGRQLDFARSGIEVLPSAMAALRATKGYTPEKFEVFVDGGVRRGTDIFKALALGAKAVGVGRPALYAMSAFGTAGVSKMIQIFKAELEMTMRLMGTPSLRDMKESMVITDHLHTHIAPVPSDFLQRETYIPAVTQAQRNRFGRAPPAAHDAAPAAPTPVTAVAGVNTFTASGVLVWEVLKGIAATIFSTVARTLLHRTSLFLLAFTLVHCGGNVLLIYPGRDAFNAYAAKMSSNPLVRVIEIYLAASFIGHAASGAYLTFKYKKLTPPRSGTPAPLKTWASTAKLALTGSAVTAFLVLHLSHFRFSDSISPPLSSGERDWHGDVLRTLRDPLTAGLYAGAVALAGLHMAWGWDKAVGKMPALEKDKPLADRVRLLGQILTAAITVGFLAATAAAHFTPLK